MNTPRTDAVGNNGGYYRSKENGWYIPADFCRQLETELDLAKRELTAVQALETKAAVTLKSRELELKAEREKVAKLRGAVKQAIPIFRSCADDHGDQLKHEHDSIAELAKALEETK